jgi:hypothetical protein
MPTCATCGGTEDLCLYERHDPRYQPRRWWWCVDCSYFAVRLNGIAAEPVAPWDERAEPDRAASGAMGVLHDRRRSAGRRATDRVDRVEA